MSFISITEDDTREMLKAIGVATIDELFIDIPESIKKKCHVSLPSPKSEIETTILLNEIEQKNIHLHSFVGAGSYDHYIPAVVDHLSSRSEFYSAYTPYQAEVSQGTLTAIFEYQTFMSRLTGMDISNASMYDGATALAEAIIMSLRSNKKNKFIISKAVHPHYREVVKTYSWANNFECIETEITDFLTDVQKLQEKYDDSIGCVVVQNPNFFGSIEQVSTIAGIIHAKKADLVVNVTEPLSLAYLKSPGESGADIACGEAISFGNPIGFGGPALGFLTATEKFLRKIPGRLVGKTTDEDGNEAYVLTLQTREQHIRRDRATSNICTNQGLCALRATMYLSLHGNKLFDLARLNHYLASYLKQQLLKKGFSEPVKQYFFNEFVLQKKNVSEFLEKANNNGFVAGLDLGKYYPEYPDCLLLCATEKHTPQLIDTLTTIL